MLAENPALKKEFEARLAADPEFAADCSAHLQWFYERSPFQNSRYLIYPIGIERRAQQKAADRHAEGGNQALFSDFTHAAARAALRGFVLETRQPTTNNGARDGLSGSCMRDMIFISNANPEDNVFARWLALQLARCGYPVWCDLTQLLGGEVFWTDIETALRDRTAKFLYLLSRTSNSKDGPLNELQVVCNVARDNRLRDFVVPLAIDDLPPREAQIQLSRLNHVSFKPSWADGLRVLLELFEREKVQKDETRFGASAVAQWWKAQFPVDQGVRPEVEMHLSNWFPLRKLPESLLLHQVSGWPHNEKEGGLATPQPSFRFARYAVSFAPAIDFHGVFEIEKTMPLATEELLEIGIEDAPIDRKQARDVVTYLLRVAWTKMIAARTFPSYELANGMLCHWFQMGFVKDDTIVFTGARGKAADRQVVGYSTVTATKEGLKAKRFWHFAFEGRPYLYPFRGFSLRPHVLFSDDGFTVWESKSRLHKARRRTCRSWWNPRWRDLLLATASFLAGEDHLIHVPLGSDIEIQVEITPVQFEAPVSFDDPVKATDTEAAIEIVDEEGMEEPSESSDDEPID